MWNLIQMLLIPITVLDLEAEVQNKSIFSGEAFEIVNPQGEISETERILLYKREWEQIKMTAEKIVLSCSLVERSVSLK